ncbi:MAG: GAF domain-containing protein [Burkholderiales bacterium]|nr:GAF domain-containing protein [Burkholderiales bacterium]
MNLQKLKTLSQAWLEEGRQRLSMSMGIVSRIEGDRYEIVAVSSRTGVFVAGEVFPLMNTYCRAVYERKVTIALTEIDGVRGLRLHPLYETLPLEAYISAPIFHESKVWGTFNFSCMEHRDQPFSDADIRWVNGTSHQISEVLSGPDVANAVTGP